VPDGLRASEEPSNSYHLWRLNVHGDMPGVDLQRSFEIPVYPGREKSRHIATLSSQHLPYGHVQADVAALVPLTQIGNRVDIHYPMLRKPLNALGLILLGDIFNGSSAFLWHRAVQDGFPLYIMSGIFHFVGGLIVLWGLYALFNSLHVQFDGRSTTAVRRILGIQVGNKTVTYPLIHAMEIKHNGSYQSDNTHHTHQLPGYRQPPRATSFWPKNWIRIARRSG
jgi:hypothetical protein